MLCVTVKHISRERVARAWMNEWRLGPYLEQLIAGVYV